MRIQATTRLVVLLGDPVEHSLSPAMQNAAFAAAGCDAVYVALRVSAPAFPTLLAGLAAAGVMGNITVPHKESGARLVACATEAVRATGACNTFWVERGQLWGDNTDVVGVRVAAMELLGELRGARALVLGAGGSARAVVWALVQGGATVGVRARRPDRAVALAQHFAAQGVEVAVVRSLRRERFDLVVNATPLGLRPEDPWPLDPEREEVAIGAALDLVYGPAPTPWVQTLRAAGIPAVDGLPVLLHQGAAAFERWWGQAAPLEAMRAALPPR